MPFRHAQLVSKVLLVLALLVFVIFHFTPGFGEERGWTIWVEVWDILGYPAYLATDNQAVLILASFLMATLLIPVSPFLGSVWIKSKLAWGACTLFAGVAATTFWFWILREDLSEVRPGGGWFLILAPTLNLFGLLFARVGLPKEGDLAARIAALSPPISPAAGGITGKMPDLPPDFPENA